MTHAAVQDTPPLVRDVRSPEACAGALRHIDGAVVAALAALEAGAANWSPTAGGLWLWCEQPRGARSEPQSWLREHRFPTVSVLTGGDGGLAPGGAARRFSAQHPNGSRGAPRRRIAPAPPRGPSPLRGPPPAHEAWARAVAHGRLHTP